VTKVLSHDRWPIHHDILNPPQQRLTSRKPLWCVMTPTDIKSQWRESWKSAPVVNAHLVDDPTIRQPGFTVPRQQWSLLNRFCTGQGHCGACRKTWRLTHTDLCSCGETQTMSHIVESCPFTKLNGGLSQLHSADDAALAWLTNYGSYSHTQEEEEWLGARGVVPKLARGSLSFFIGPPPNSASV